MPFLLPDLTSSEKRTGADILLHRRMYAEARYAASYQESGPIWVLGCDLSPGGIDVSVGRWALRTKSVRCS
jgi:hypothetical protein